MNSVKSIQNLILPIKYAQKLVTVMLVATFCWWLYGGSFKMLMTLGWCFLSIWKISHHHLKIVTNTNYLQSVTNNDVTRKMASNQILKPNPNRENPIFYFSFLSVHWTSLFPPSPITSNLYLTVSGVQNSSWSCRAQRLHFVHLWHSASVSSTGSTPDRFPVNGRSPKFKQ